MSWKDRIKTGYTITTGDGRSYVSQWLNASKNIEYNVAQFEFKELEGTLVYRGTPRGTRYAIEIYFQGEDHLDLSTAFEKSAADPRAWTIAHPLYGNILVQPIGLTFDNSGYNVTKITGGIVETIATTPDKPTLSAPDKIVADKEATDAAFADAYAGNVPAPKAADTKSMIANAAAAYSATLSNISNTLDAEQYLNTFNAANDAITNAGNDTAQVIIKAQNLLSQPYKLQNTVTERIAMLVNLLAYLNGTVAGSSQRSAKLLYENNAGTVITSIIAAAVTNIASAYSNRRQVLDTIASILSGYNLYLKTLDSLQTATGGLIGSYIPSRFPLTLLSQLVGYALNALLDIAADSRQERSFFLEENSNVIMLAHRLYGLKEDDSTIDELIAVNEIGLNEILELKKGRKITYYV